MLLATISPEFAGAIVSMQSQIEGAKKGRDNPQFKSKYADLASVWDACSAALEANNLAVLQFPVTDEPGFVGLRTILVYGKTGENISDVFRLPLKDHNNAQAAGSALTYARRYALSAIIGICPEDDDGNRAAAGPNKVQNAPVRGPKATAASQAGVDRYRALFAVKCEQADEQGMKELYRDVRNSGIDEPAKTSLLNEMAKTINEVFKKVF